MTNDQCIVKVGESNAACGKLVEFVRAGEKGSAGIVAKYSGYRHVDGTVDPHHAVPKSWI